MDKKICRGSKFATATSNGSSCKSVNNNSGGSKRDALAELTNSLIPTEVLLDLCSNSISSSKAYDLLRSSRTPTFPISKSSQNSKSDSKSDTSIGSSNFNDVRDSQIPQLSNSSSTYVGIAAYSRRQTSENLEGRRKIDSELVISAPAKKKKKDEENKLLVRSSTTPSYKAKNKQNALALALDLIDEKERAKENEILVPSFEKLNDIVKSAAGSRSSTRVKKPKDKGKAIAEPFTITSAEKGKEKGKAVAVPLCHLNEQAEDKEKSTAMLINQRLKKERRNARAAVSSCPPLWRTTRMRDELNEADDVKTSKAWSDPHPKHKKRRCSEQQTVSDYSLLQEVEKQKAYFQEIDAFELPVEEASGIDLD